MTKFAFVFAITGLCVAMLAGCAPSPEELRNRGAAQFQVGNSEGARQTLQQVLDQKPSDSVSLYYMGRIHFNDGFYEQAAYYFRSAVDADPSNEPARLWLAKAQAAMGKSKVAPEAPPPQE